MWNKLISFRLWRASVPADWLSGCRARRRGGHRRRQKLALERRSWHRSAEVITLALLASHLHEKVGGSPALDALRYHRQAELPAETNGRADDCRIVRIGEQVEHERPVDFESIEWEFLQIAQARIAGAEVVEHGAHAKFLNSEKRIKNPFLIEKQNILRQFQLKQRRRKPSGGKHLGDRTGKIARLQLRR